MNSPLDSIEILSEYTSPLNPNKSDLHKRICQEQEKINNQTTKICACNHNGGTQPAVLGYTQAVQEEIITSIGCPNFSDEKTCQNFQLLCGYGPFPPCQLQEENSNVIVYQLPPSK